MDSNAPRAHRQQALAAYVEPLAVGRRVAVLGDSSLALGARIAELGAQSVQVWDPDADRARRAADLAPRGVVVRPVPRRGSRPEGAGDERGAFDLVVIPDLELFDDAPDVLARVRTLVGDQGAALVCAPNREGDADPAAYGYYELFDLVAGQFDDVTMIAQLPFQGVALAELAEDEEGESPAVTVDTQLASSSRTPEAFVALGSQRGVRLDPYAIVELPERVSADEGAAEAVEREEAKAVHLAIAQAGARTAGLEEEVEDLRARLAGTEQGARAAQRLEEALQERSARVAELESALAASSRDVVELSQEVQRLRVLAETERAVGLQLEALVVRAERAERALAAAEPDQARTAEIHAAELARYEEVLIDRAQAMRALEAELGRRERMVRELVDAIGDAGQEAGGAPKPSPVPTPTPAGEVAPEYAILAETNAQLRQKLDALALDLARRQGEAQASGWTIAELQRRLDSETRPVVSAPDDTPGPQVPSDPDAQSRLAAALDELNVLRRALAQEHEARLRAESAGAPLHKGAQD